MTSGLPHTLVVSVILVATWQEALIAGLAFGGGRAWMTLSRHVYPEKEAWDRSLRKHDRLIRVVLTLVSGVALALVVHVLLDDSP